MLLNVVHHQVHKNDITKELTGFITNQSISHSIFIAPKIKRYILNYISCWESKNT